MLSVVMVSTVVTPAQSGTQGEGRRQHGNTDQWYFPELPPWTRQNTRPLSLASADSFLPECTCEYHIFCSKNITLLIASAVPFLYNTNWRGHGFWSEFFITMLFYMNRCGKSLIPAKTFWMSILSLWDSGKNTGKVSMLFTQDSVCFIEISCIPWKQGTGMVWCSVFLSYTMTAQKCQRYLSITASGWKLHFFKAATISAWACSGSRETLWWLHRKARLLDFIMGRSVWPAKCQPLNLSF